jgi:hypothetical protein
MSAKLRWKHGSIPGTTCIQIDDAETDEALAHVMYDPDDLDRYCREIMNFNEEVRAMRDRKRRS